MSSNENGCEWKMWMKNVNEWDENVILFEWSDGACQWETDARLGGWLSIVGQTDRQTDRKTGNKERPNEEEKEDILICNCTQDKEKQTIVIDIHSKGRQVTARKKRK